jgi:hypothetical protein
MYYRLYDLPVVMVSVVYATFSSVESGQLRPFDATTSPNVRLALALPTASTLAVGLDQFPYSREMMIVVLGDKIQMVYESHRRLQTRVGNGTSK